VDGDDFAGCAREGRQQQRVVLVARQEHQFTTAALDYGAKIHKDPIRASVRGCRGNEIMGRISQSCNKKSTVCRRLFKTGKDVGTKQDRLKAMVGQDGGPERVLGIGRF
jgi:hypothetical protein